MNSRNLYTTQLHRIFIMAIQTYGHSELKCSFGTNKKKVETSKKNKKF